MGIPLHGKLHSPSGAATLATLAPQKHWPVKYERQIWECGGRSGFTIVFKASIAIVVAFTVRSALLHSGVGELQHSLKRQRATCDRVVETARVNEASVRIHAWRLGRVVSRPQRR